MGISIKSIVPRVLILTSLGLTGCDAGVSQFADVPNSPSVFFATNRPQQDRGFSGGSIDDLRFGRAIVKAPEIRDRGDAGGMSVEQTALLGPVQFLAGLRAQMDGNPARLVIFIHGYNTSFEEGLIRADQLRRDLFLTYDEPMIHFSWPSQGTTLGYFQDEAIAERYRDLMVVLEKLRGEFPTAEIDVIAHSMGSRILLAALRNSSASLGIDSLVFAAPDVDQLVFKLSLGIIASQARHVSLYANSHDWALRASRHLHGAGDRQRRAGEGGDGILIHPNLDTIDFSDRPRRLTEVNHSHFASDRLGLDDLMLNITQNRRAAERTVQLEQVTTSDGRYWKVRN